MSRAHEQSGHPRRASAPGSARAANAPSTPVALSIAGSDSGGGAGIEADLKAFARCGVHGTCAITVITAQSTRGLAALYALPPQIVVAQVRAVIADMRVRAVKVGMLGSLATTLAVASALDELEPGTPVVVDPVMAASSGASLLDRDARAALVEEIVPRAAVLTPNLPEARVLVGEAAAPTARAVDEDGEAEELVRALARLGADAVVLTGGHRERAADLFLEAASRKGPVEISGPRYPSAAEHGSGCTHSAVLAAQLALGATPLEAARRARELAGIAIAQGLADVGAGSGPVDVLGLEGLRGREL
jgi:hydroxymethylpyrimidine/phosphomethylpyrimidine kinase